MLGSASKNAPPILKSLEYRSCSTPWWMEIWFRGQADPRCLPWSRAGGNPYEDCAVFEDSQAGIEAANRAGMYSIGVSRAGALQGCKEQIADLSLIGGTS